MAETPLIPEDAETTGLPVPSRGHIGLVVLGSIAASPVAALVLALLVFGGFREPSG